jgi:hypothetical protein
VRSWTPLRRRKLRILLQLSALALFFSVLPLLTYRLAENPGFWRWALGCYGVAHLADLSSFLFWQPQGAWRAPVYPGVVFAVLQLAVAALGGTLASETMYMVSVAWHVAGAAMGFVFLIWGETSGPTPEA